MKEPINVIKRENGLYGQCPICNRKIIVCKFCPKCGEPLNWDKKKKEQK